MILSVSTNSLSGLIYPLSLGHMCHKRVMKFSGPTQNYKLIYNMFLKLFYNSIVQFTNINFEDNNFISQF